MHTQTAPDAKEVFEELRQTLLWEIDHPKEGMASKIAQLAEAMERLIPAIPVKRSPWADVLAAMQGELQTIIDKVRAINPNARGHVNAARSTDVLLLMRCALQIEERSFVLLISYKPTKDITAIDVRAELRNESTGETLMRRRSTVCEITSEELIDASREILPTLEILQEMAA